MLHAPAGQPGAHRLHLDRQQRGLGPHAQQREQADGADAAAQIEQAQRVRAGAAGGPGGQHVVGGEAVAAPELVDPPAAAEVIERRVHQARCLIFPRELRDPGAVAEVKMNEPSFRGRGIDWRPDDTAG